MLARGHTKLIQWMSSGKGDASVFRKSKLYYVLLFFFFFSFLRIMFVFRCYVWVHPALWMSVCVFPKLPVRVVMCNDGKVVGALKSPGGITALVSSTVR